MSLTLWQRFRAWLARPDPYDVDSHFPDGTLPTPTDLHVPGENTQKLYRPTYWDELSKKDE